MNFGLGNLGSGLSLMRILGSISKTLGLVNQVAPIYRQVKPLIVNAPRVISKFLNRQPSFRPAPITNNVNPSFNTQQMSNTNNSGPVFFQ